MTLPPALHRLPSWLAALLAQLGGVLLAFGLARSGMVSSGALLIGCQAVTAALISRLLRRERWWLLIHLCFMPLLLAARSADIDPSWYLAAFVLLLLTFWGTLRTRVPLYLSGRDAVEAVDTLLPDAPALRVLDIGCGTGALLTPLAGRHPQHHFTGVESAPLPWLIARIAARGHANLSIRRGDFFTHDWSAYDVVYAFLSTHPMEQVAAKARAELAPHALLISKEFAAPGLQPERTLTLPSDATLYCYRPGAAADRTD
ncbi:MAG: class I SAM-dependent methyltransferase [Pseudazoarcus pumilus]|nr:class I SAM-dependent methyltransferase [Pseudazoarcus pumilus]